MYQSMEFGTSYHLRGHPDIACPTSCGFLPAWAVRIIKSFLLTLPASLILVVIIILLQGATRGRSSGTVGTSRSGRRMRETVRDFVERTNLCEDVPLQNRTKYSSLCEKIYLEKILFYSRNSQQLNKFLHGFLVSNKETCNNKTDIIVLVHSLHDNGQAREAIRKTWGKAAESKQWPNNVTLLKNIQVRFVLGVHQNPAMNVKIYQEHVKYGDIIQGDFYEHYHNMTLKSLLGLKWFAEHCPGAKYLLKSDDDMIINFPALQDVLRNETAAYSIMGPYNAMSRVLRKGKWALSREEFPFYYFPPYESGSAYLITGDLVADLYEASRFVPRIFIDDVYITGILAKVVGARHVLRYGFAYWNTKAPNVCDIAQNKVITSTHMSPMLLLKIWKELQQGGC